MALARYMRGYDIAAQRCLLPCSYARAFDLGVVLMHYAPCCESRAMLFTVLSLPLRYAFTFSLMPFFFFARHMRHFDYFALYAAVYVCRRRYLLLLLPCLIAAHDAAMLFYDTVLLLTPLRLPMPLMRLILRPPCRARQRASDAVIYAFDYLISDLL